MDYLPVLKTRTGSPDEQVARHYRIVSGRDRHREYPVAELHFRPDLKTPVIEQLAGYGRTLVLEFTPPDGPVELLKIAWTRNAIHAPDAPDGAAGTCLGIGFIFTEPGKVRPRTHPERLFVPGTALITPGGYELGNVYPDPHGAVVYLKPPKKHLE
jgi:hypothetical protein